MLISFEIYVRLTQILALGQAYVGLSVDEPLPEKIGGTDKVKGIINIYVVGEDVTFGPTSIMVNVGRGTHYVVLGIQPAPSVPLIPSVMKAYLRLRGLGVTSETTITIPESIRYVYIAFEVTVKNNVETVNVIGTGTIAPGGVPISTSGGGSISGGEMFTQMGDTMAELMKDMMPLIFFAMMINMMMSLMTGMLGAIV